MVQYLVSFELRRDVNTADYAEWVRDSALPFWELQPGFRSIHGFHTIVGHGATIVTEINFSNLDDLARCLTTKDYESIREGLIEFAENIDSRILVATGRIGGN